MWLTNCPTLLTGSHCNTSTVDVYISWRSGHISKLTVYCLWKPNNRYGVFPVIILPHEIPCIGLRYVWGGSTTAMFPNFVHTTLKITWLSLTQDTRCYIVIIVIVNLKSIHLIFHDSYYSYYLPTSYLKFPSATASDYRIR